MHVAASIEFVHAFYLDVRSILVFAGYILFYNPTLQVLPVIFVRINRCEERFIGLCAPAVLEHIELCLYLAVIVQFACGLQQIGIKVSLFICVSCVFTTGSIFTFVIIAVINVVPILISFIDSFHTVVYITGPFYQITTHGDVVNGDTAQHKLIAHGFGVETQDKVNLGSQTFHSDCFGFSLVGYLIFTNGCHTMHHDRTVESAIGFCNVNDDVV